MLRDKYGICIKSMPEDVLNALSHDNYMDIISNIITTIIGCAPRYLFINSSLGFTPVVLINHMEAK